MSIGSAIRKKRTEANLTQKQLADAVNVTTSMISQIERNSKLPTLILGKEIADALGCKSVEEFFLEQSVE